MKGKLERRSWQDRRRKAWLKKRGTVKCATADMLKIILNFKKGSVGNEQE